MALYVLAITDGPIRPARVGGRMLHDIDVNGVHAICERRQKVPDISDDVLRAQHQTVTGIARHVRGILPVRFGALLARAELVELLRAHEPELRRALDDVRGRVQMTTRVLGNASRRQAAASTSGRQYLERRRQIVSPELPPRATAFLAAVEPFVVRERREAGAIGLLATVYHLVNAADVRRFKAIARKMSDGGIISTGPWPPFAFTPQLF